MMLAVIRAEGNYLVFFLAAFLTVFLATVFLVPQHPFLAHVILSPFEKNRISIAALLLQFLHRNQFCYRQNRENFFIFATSCLY